MPLIKLTLRVRIFLFFAVLMILIPLIIGLAISAAYFNPGNDLPRMISTYTGLAAIILMLITILIWQMFDRHVASALQSLARQMQTALHSTENPLENDHSLRYLDPAWQAASDVVNAHHALRTALSTREASPVHDEREAQRLATLVHELDVAVLVMNLEHRILLYNPCAVHLLDAGPGVGLGRSAERLFASRSLSMPVDSWIDDTADTCQRLCMTLETKAHNQQLNARACRIFGEEDKVSGYVLVLEAAGEKPAADDGQIRVPASNGQGLSVSANAVLSHSRSTGTISTQPRFYDFDLLSRGPMRTLAERTLKQRDFVVFDTETTGLNPSRGDEIISIAAVRVVNGRVLVEETFDEMISPGRRVPASSTAFHGITDDMLADKPRIEDVLPRFVRFVDDATLVAHNAAFDMKFIELKKVNCQIELPNPVLDTVLLSAWLHDHTHDHTLDTLAHRFGLTINGRHTALGDAVATAHVFCKLMEQLSSRGITTLNQALEISASMKHITRQQKAY